MSGSEVRDDQTNLAEFIASRTQPNQSEKHAEETTDQDEDAASTGERDRDNESESPASDHSVDIGCPNPLLESYIRKRVQDNRLAPSTARKSYGPAIRQFLEYIDDNDIDIEAAQCEHVRDFLNWLTDWQRQATIDKKLVAVRDFFRYIAAYRDEVDLSINHARLEDIKSPDSELSTMTRTSLTKEEVAQLLGEIGKPRDRLMVILAVLRGPRSGALRHLKVDDVNLEAGEITLQDWKDDDEYTLPLGDKLQRYFAHWLNHVRPSYANAEENPYMFPPESGEGPLEEGAFAKTVREAAEELGIQKTLGEVHFTKNQIENWDGPGETRNQYKVTPHAFRHTFNNLLKDRGVPLEVRQELLNHNDVSSILEHYDDEIEEVREFLDELEDIL